MREPLQQSRGDSYERPNQPWVCGLAGEGASCPMGPGRRGRCPAAAACHPVREGDRWRCNRTNHRGGTCDEGPTPEGVCCHVYRCAPLRSLRSRRGRFVVGCLLATLGAIFTLLSSDWRNEVLAPGPLSVHHAQLLQRGDQTDRCASCHAAGTQSFIQWAKHLVDPQLAEPNQTQLCLECHAKEIPRQWATAAHSVDFATLQAIDDGPISDTQVQKISFDRRKVDPSEPLACSACHREHHGAMHDLKWMSDHACQACHEQQFDSFATDHPEFSQWPENRRTRIAFDHAAHEAKHFPKEKKTFECAVCHEQDSQGDFQKTLSYEAACANCHDREVAASWQAGVAMFALPMLEVEAFRDEGLDIGQWPEEAADEFDGALPPITKLLLIADPAAAEALELLGIGFDFFDIDSADSEQMQAASVVVWATKELLFDLTQEGHAAVRRRVEGLLGRTVSLEELTELVAHLSPESLAVIIEHWLAKLPAEIAARRQDASDQQPSTTAHPLAPQDRAASQQRLEAGGWFRDNLTLSIRYRATGHADRLVTAWIDVLAEATRGPQSELAEPLLKQMMKPTAPGLCGQCHSVDRRAGGGFDIHWLSKRAGEIRSEFTQFSHQPHLLQSQLSDCRHCHRIATDAPVMASYVGQSPVEYERGFQPIVKQDCTECHSPRAAGDRCLQCHQYHVGHHTQE